jgi:transposase
VIKAIRFRFPWLRNIFADGGYTGPKLRQALAEHGDWSLEIIKRSDTAKSFIVLPRRLGQFSTEINRHSRRLARGAVRDLRTHENPI